VFILLLGDFTKEENMTNREAHEEAAGIQLEDLFFLRNGIDPDAEYTNQEHFKRLLMQHNDPVVIDKSGGNRSA
jgi:hypothetical protein